MPSPARRFDYRLKARTFPQEVLDYLLERGISLGLCYKGIFFMEMLQQGRVCCRYIPDRNPQAACQDLYHRCLRNAWVQQLFFTGFRRQLEANVRFDSQKELKRYREARHIAENYWELGEDYNDDLLNLLQQASRHPAAGAQGAVIGRG